jgi:hypothetical protein
MGMPRMTLSNDGDFNSALDKLSAETQKLRKLRELLAQKLANYSEQKDLSEIAAQAKRTQGELLELMTRVENFAGEVIERRCNLNFPS